MPERFKGHKLPGILYAYPWEVITSLAQIGIGLAVVLVPGLRFFQLDSLTINLAFAVILVLAGALTMVGLIGYRRDWQAGVEQLGLWLGSAAMFSYALLILSAGADYAQFAAVVFIAGSLASALRAKAIRILHAKRLEELTVANALREESARHARTAE